MCSRCSYQFQIVYCLLIIAITISGICNINILFIISLFNSFKSDLHVNIIYSVALLHGLGQGLLSLMTRGKKNER